MKDCSNTNIEEIHETNFLDSDFVMIGSCLVLVSSCSVLVGSCLVLVGSCSVLVGSCFSNCESNPKSRYEGFSNSRDKVACYFKAEKHRQLFCVVRIKYYVFINLTIFC